MLASAEYPAFSAFPQRWTRGSRIELGLDSVTPTDLKLIPSPQPNENTMSCAAVGCIAVDSKVSVDKKDWPYISVNRHRLGSCSV